MMRVQILHRGPDGRVWWLIETEDLAAIDQIVDEDGSSARRIMPATRPETDTPSVDARATNAAWTSGSTSACTLARLPGMAT